MQLVLHAPFGSRINKAWGLALRKRFCRQFNFELQAAATDDGLLLSLGPQHSFPLADVFRYLHPATARDVLVQAFLDAPVFKTRWRWNTNLSLAVPRNRGGKKVAPQLQRMLADDLMAAVFPDAAACLENIPGDRRDSGSSAGQPDRARLPAGSDGLRRGSRRFSRASIAASCSWSRATRRSPRRSRTSSSTRGRTPFSTMRRSRSGARRRSTRGAPPSRAPATTSARSTRRRSRACATKRDPIRATPTSCTTRCSRSACSPKATSRRRQTCLSASPDARRATRVDLAGAASARWVAAERLPEVRAVFASGVDRSRRQDAGGARGAGVDAGRGDRRAGARPHDDRRPDHRRRDGDVRSVSPRLTSTRRSSRSNPRA